MAASLCALAMRIAVLAALLAIVGASPQVSYPLNSQFPPIAYVGEPFLFQFAPTTFKSDFGNLSYSLSNSPPWLSIDGKTGTLSGTPGARYVGTASFRVNAAGSAGAVANMDSTLLVSQGTGPRVSANISQALSAAGPLSAPTTLAIKASRDFEISFPPNLFDSDSKLSYFATLSDHTPLPAWLSFDASTLRLAGTTPPTNIPQFFGILLIASDTPGYASSTVQFALSISAHELYFEPAIQTLNVTKGVDVHITGLKRKLRLDQSPISDRDIQSPSAELPDWLTFDSSSFDISGKAPTELSSQDLTISANDIYGDSAQYTIRLNIVSELFSGTVDTLNITLGELFKFQLPQSILAKDDEVVTVDFATLSDHMNFNPNTLTIFGTVPADQSPQVVLCTITATSKDGSLKESQPFNITLLAAADATPNNDSTLSGHGDTFDTTKTDTSGQHTGVIVGVVLAAIFGAVLLAACIFCICRRRRQAKSYLSPKLGCPKSPRGFRKSEISRPKFIPFGWPDIEEEDLEKGKDHDDISLERTPEHAPKIDVNLPHEHRNSGSVTDSMNDGDTRILDDFGESSWGYIGNNSAPSDRPADSMKIAVELAKRASQNSTSSFRKHKRRTTTVYRDQIHRSSGLPVNRRITGMVSTLYFSKLFSSHGHGRHTYSPSRSNNNFGSLRRAMSSSLYSRRTSSLSTVPTACPQAPAARSRQPKVTTPTEERHSIRVVPSSTRSSLGDRRTIEDKRSSYIRKRASAQSPFFSAGYRASSSSYRSPPAFLTEKQRRSRNFLSPSRANTIVKPGDDVEEGKEKEVPCTPLHEKPEPRFPGSLRKHRSTKSLANQTKKAKSPSRPATTLPTTSTTVARRASSRKSLLASELKASLNDLTGSEIYDNADLSESVYTDEEDDIEDYDKRTTVKPGQYTLPPLNLDSRRSALREKRSSRRNSQLKDNERKLKRTSEREPTPHYLAKEHGGKENVSSTYSLGRITPIPETKVISRAALSPAPPNSFNVARNSQVIAVPRKSILRETRARPVSRAASNTESTNERHSRRSLHSRNQSRVSGARRTPRGHSRSQSSAFPFFDPDVTEDTAGIREAITPPTHAAKMAAKGTASSVTRDLSGNLIYHGDDTLGSSSMVFNAPSAPGQRHSNVPSGVPRRQSMGLGLYPSGGSAAELNGERVRNPLSEVGASVDVERAETPGKGRRTWGDGLKTMMGRSSLWGWDKEKDDVKVFV